MIVVIEYVIMQLLFEALTVRSDCESVELTLQAKREWLFEEGLKVSRGLCGCAHVYFR